MPVDVWVGVERGVEGLVTLRECKRPLRTRKSTRCGQQVLFGYLTASYSAALKGSRESSKGVLA